MSNVLSEEKRQQVIALGQLGWPLRRIEKATGVRRETAGGLPEGGRDRRATAGRLGPAGAGKTGQWGDHRPWRAKTGHPSDHRLRREKPDIDSKPANEVTTDLVPASSTGRGVPYARPPAPASRTGNSIELGLPRGRNANGDLAGPGRRLTVSRRATRA